MITKLNYLAKNHKKLEKKTLQNNTPINVDKSAIFFKGSEKTLPCYSAAKPPCPLINGTNRLGEQCT